MRNLREKRHINMPRINAMSGMRCQANRRRKGKELDDRIAEHRTPMARGNSREEGNRGGKAYHARKYASKGEIGI